MIYLQLFLSFLQIGLFSFGGGYAAMPLIQGQVVDAHGWLSMSEFTDLITISQMTPGPIAINAATFVGIKIAGLPGALAATLSRRFGRHPGLHPTLLRHRHLHRLAVPAVPEASRPAERAEFAAAGRRSHDCLRRRLHSGDCLLGKRGADHPCRHQLDAGRHLPPLRPAPAERKNESHLGHGAGRRSERRCVSILNASQYPGE